MYMYGSAMKFSSSAMHVATQLLVTLAQVRRASVVEKV